MLYTNYDEIHGTKTTYEKFAFIPKSASLAVTVTIVVPTCFDSLMLLLYEAGVNTGAWSFMSITVTATDVPADGL
jgi:hypothetical protein